MSVLMKRAVLIFSFAVWSLPMLGQRIAGASSPGWINVKSHGARGDGVTNDATAIDAAIAAAQAGRGNVVYFPQGSYRYTGAGILFNPRQSTPISLLGDGAHSTRIQFDSVTNDQAILLGSETTVGSAPSFGGGISNLEIQVVQREKDGIVVENREFADVANVYIYGGRTALVVKECRFGRFSHIYADQWNLHGVKLVGERFATNFFSDIQINGAQGSSHGFDYTKTTPDDAGGFFCDGLVVNAAGGDGIHIENTTGSVVNVFAFFSNTAADGTFGGNAFHLKKVGAVYVSNSFAVNHTDFRYGVLLDQVREVTWTGGVFYGGGIGSADLRLQNGCSRVAVTGAVSTGPVAAISTDESAHGTLSIAFTSMAAGEGTFSLGELPAPSALMTLSSTTKGFLPPRMTEAQRNAIAAPEEGLVIYSTTNRRIELYNGTSWVGI